MSVRTFKHFPVGHVATHEIHRFAEPFTHWLIRRHLLITSYTLSISGLALKQGAKQVLSSFYLCLISLHSKGPQAFILASCHTSISLWHTKTQQKLIWSCFLFCLEACPSFSHLSPQTPARFIRQPLPFPATSHLSLPKPFHSLSSELPSFPCKSDRHLTRSIQRFQMPKWPAAALGKPEPRALSSSGSRNSPPLWAWDGQKVSPG